MLTKQQGQVAVDILCFQIACCLNTLPSGGHFDQYPLRIDARFLIGFNIGDGFINGGVGVIRQPCIDFSGHAPLDQLQNIAAKLNG